MTTVGELVRQWRHEAKMSQRRLAELVGVSFPHISKIEADREQASSELLERIAKALGKDADELFAAVGRLPSDVAEIVRSDPTTAFRLLRQMPSSRTGKVSRSGG
ncbi:MAG: helix-turn-helix domain-containing protein [Acidimicrobiales bacterium]